jgi:hypothetical protein
MAQRLSDHSWIVLLVLAISLVVACSSSSNTSSDQDSGPVPDATTAG